jgi:FKBP-type peptidyl-prolyl cis-trans isomerase
MKSAISSATKLSVTGKFEGGTKFDKSLIGDRAKSMANNKHG